MQQSIDIDCNRATWPHLPRINFGKNREWIGYCFAMFYSPLHTGNDNSIDVCYNSTFTLHYVSLCSCEKLIAGITFSIDTIGCVIVVYVFKIHHQLARKIRNKPVPWIHHVDITRSCHLSIDTSQSFMHTLMLDVWIVFKNIGWQRRA
jgi:hypothetical protein